MFTSFQSVKFEFTDLDGLSWTSPEASRLLQQWVSPVQHSTAAHLVAETTHLNKHQTQKLIIPSNCPQSKPAALSPSSTPNSPMLVRWNSGNSDDTIRGCKILDPDLASSSPILPALSFDDQQENQTLTTTNRLPRFPLPPPSRPSRIPARTVSMPILAQLSQTTKLGRAAPNSLSRASECGIIRDHCVTRTSLGLSSQRAPL